MVDQSDPVYEQASRQATEWLVLLGEAPQDKALQCRFDAWMLANPLHRRAWEETLGAADAIRQVSPHHADDWRPFLESRRRQAMGASHAGSKTATSPSATMRPSRRRVLQLTGLAAGLTAFAAFGGPRLLLGMRADYTTGTAETALIDLPDGSTVTLAPESAFAVDFGQERRAVRLLAGEAFFEVASDPRLPFQVTGKRLEITVLGTRFNLHIDASDDTVGVEEGSIRVARLDNASTLTEKVQAGQALRLGRTGQAMRLALPPGEAAPWRNNRLIARDQSLGEVVDQLRRYYQGRILVTDADLAARSVTGIYDLSDPVRALQAIARAQHAAVRQATPWLLIVSPS